MVAKPVAEKGNSKYLIWELSDINLNFIDDKLLSNLNWKNYNQDGNRQLKQPDTRQISTTFDSSVFADELKEMCRSIYLSQDYDIFSNTSFDLDTTHWASKNIESWKVELIKDSSEHNLDVHLDNPSIVSTFIINLTDNKNSTQYYYDNQGTSLLYKGPTVKGTGVFHINTPYVYHSVQNNSNTDRFVLMGNLSLNFLT